MTMKLAVSFFALVVSNAAAGEIKSTKSTEAFMKKWAFGLQGAASAGQGVPSAARKLFGVYYDEEATPTAAPSEAPSEAPTMAPSIPGPCPGGTFVDFEGIEIVLNDTSFFDVSDGVQVAYKGEVVESLVTSFDAEFIDASDTNFTSGGIFGTASLAGPDAAASVVKLPFPACKITFGFSVDAAGENAVRVKRVLLSNGTETSTTASAETGAFERASGSFTIDAGPYDEFEVTPLVSGGDITTLNLDNVCAIPCAPMRRKT